VKRCHTTVSALPQLCTADGCLADNKRQMLNKILSGPKSSAGTQLYGGAPWDPGLGTAQWRQWRVSAADGVVPYPAMTVFGGALAEIMSVPPSLLCDSGNIYPMNPDGTYGSGLFRPSAATCTPTMSVQWKYVSTLDVDTIYGLTHTTNAFFPESGASQIDVPDPANLSAFKARGGKLITFTGTADPLVSVDEITSWYDDVLRRDANATNYTAYYLVPGMNHCYGGQSMDKFNLFDTLESWVWRQDNSGLPVALNERPWASTRACANSVDYLESYAGDGPCNAGLTGVTTNVTRELCRYPKVLRVAPGSSAFTCTAP